MSKNPNSTLAPPVSRLFRSTAQLTPQASKLIYSACTAHLATADKSGVPHVIPICFVFDGKSFCSPIDEKPKRTTQLKRLKNIAENPTVALVIDRYDEDWCKLAYVLVHGKARVLRSGERHRAAVKLLRAKYRQYRTMAIDERPMIVIAPKQLVCWSAEPQRFWAFMKRTRRSLKPGSIERS
ncbi:MAG: TIGR03668 family PPOX class F420-dependent oxidoreductase [Deltaproteobacteria bacterium]|nr:TIGR03668 family PPOX class F420-dependent oxidoreductase [Deltaproteobacteria bacterium]